MAGVATEPSSIEPSALDVVRHRAIVAGFGLVVLLAFVFAQWGRVDASSAGVERMLRHGFLQPMSDAGLPYEVVDACHYARPTPDLPWHFSVVIKIGAPTPKVIAALRARTHVVIRHEDLEPIVQQYPGQPERGWDGMLFPSGSETTLELVRNNVHTNDHDIGVGWLRNCPDSPTPGNS